MALELCMVRCYLNQYGPTDQFNLIIHIFYILYTLCVSLVSITRSAELLIGPPSGIVPRYPNGLRLTMMDIITYNTREQLIAVVTLFLFICYCIQPLIYIGVHTEGMEWFVPCPLM